MPDPLTPFEWSAKAQEARDIGASMLAMHAASVEEFGEPAVRCG
jgi:hypothetical protein